MPDQTTLACLQRAEGNVSSSAFCLLFFLSEQYNKKPLGETHITCSVQTMITETKLSRPTIIKAIASLEKKKCIEVIRIASHTSSYRPI